MDNGIGDISSILRAISSYHWWQIVIELLLIGIFVFLTLRFLQGTRGMRLLRGIAVILLLMWFIVRVLASKWDLGRVSFLYDKFISFTAILVVVVFQPELRRALMRLAETRFFRRWSSQIADEVNMLVESASFLSKRKIGAVIAIERDVGLGGIAESGTRLDAELTPDLLNTIFWPNSPLHDLGVIVSQGRVAYAAVQFPLAESGDLEKELGSRHRAAVGMSQETDALVLVVSEETGDISLAERGQLFRKLTPDALRDLLGELLGAEMTQANESEATTT